MPLAVKLISADRSMFKQKYFVGNLYVLVIALFFKSRASLIFFQITQLQQRCPGIAC
jgi:hypothetical protein